LPWKVELDSADSGSAHFEAGHSFPTNARALKRLRDLTTELRLAGRAAEPDDSDDSDMDDE
jgi:hypothetical protein